MSYQYKFEISVIDGDSTVNVESLGLPAPRSTFLPYQESIAAADAGARGLGWESAIWEWDALTLDQYDTLRALCTGASVACWIRTLTDDYDEENYIYYSATLRWPQPPDQRRAGRALQMRLEFVALVAYTPTPPEEPEE